MEGSTACAKAQRWEGEDSSEDSADGAGWQGGCAEKVGRLHPFSKHALSTCYVLDTIVSAGDRAMSKILPSWTLHSERGRSAINKIKSHLMGMRNMEKEGLGGAGQGLAEEITLSQDLRRQRLSCVTV